MDENQKKPVSAQADPQLVATLTEAVLKTLQATGNMPQQDHQHQQEGTDVKTVDLIGLFFAILEKFWLVVTCALVGAVALGLVAAYSTTTYTATSKLYIVDTSGGTLDIANLQLGNALRMDYQEVFKTWEVHEMVIDELDLPYTYEEMQKLLVVTNPSDTRILYISATHTDAKMAANIANAYAKAAKTFIINTMRGEEPSSFSIALEPSIGETRSKAQWVIMGFLLGSVLAMGVLTLQFVLDTRPRSPEHIESCSGIPTLAVFPDKETTKQHTHKSTGTKPKSKSRVERLEGMPYLEIGNFPDTDFVSREAMNTLCTNLSYCGSDVRKVLITSRYAGEGKSYTAMNLMRTLSRLGRSVVLVDTDMRASGIQSDYQLRYSTEKHYGLSEYLSGHSGIMSALYQTNLRGAFLIPAGHDAPNPLQLLDTENMRNLIDWLGTQFDVVLVDTPPIGVLVDAIALAKFCDGALLVVGYCKGTQHDIADAVKNIRQTNCKMLGAVLNSVKFKRLSNKYYYYSSDRYYGHYYSRYSKYSKYNKYNKYSKYYSDGEKTT